MELLAEGAAGGIGGLVGRTAAFPFDTMKVKLATREGGTGAAALVAEILREEGFGGFYRGLLFSSFEALYQKFLYVYTYAAFKKAYSRVTGKADPTVVAAVVCGYLADLACVPFSMPLEAMVVQLQSAPVGASRSAIVRAALFTYEGLSSSLKSGQAYFVLSLKPGFEFAIFDRVKGALLKRRALAGLKGGSDLQPLTALLFGAVARAVATLLVYPYARGKALSQAKLAPSAYQALLRVLQTEGARAMYQGLGMELLRGVTQAAVMFAVMERVRSVMRRLIIGA